jgi:hypothetical protein
MSLAFNAAPFNEEPNNDNDYIAQKKRSHNKTQKRPMKESFNTQKVNSVLEKIHNINQDDEDGENDEMGDFNPPPKPESSGVTKTIANENMSNMSNNMNQNMFRTFGRAPQPNYQDSELESNNYSNYGTDESIDKYYKKMLPGYDPSKIPVNQAYHNIMNTNNPDLSMNKEDVLLKKLNYMITLLEEQQDEKTNNVTEEVVLYSFLGIFIIFIIDSFVRVGKYTR